MQAQGPAGVLASLRPEPLQRVLVFTLALVCWGATGIGSFSGKNSPPMYGDFEAQRHWMELTTQKKASEWYFYDLQWWGLDYPPLTAYHSYFFGKIGTLFDSSWFALDVSRGNEDATLVSFMRNSVIISQIAFWVPALYVYACLSSKDYKTTFAATSVYLVALLLNPSLVLVDNGHFQYNSVMLGLVVGTICALHAKRYCVASFLFVSALMFKQMALYYAPVVFFYILGHCFSRRGGDGLSTLVSVGVTVIATSLLYLSPFLSQEQIKQVIIRVFPFARGLWEDKVANFWCVANTIIKFKLMFSSSTLSLLALVATSIAMLPSCILAFSCAFNKRGHRVLPYVFSLCSWAFFLFSFQVHEKSVLLPLVPATLLLFQGDASVNGMVFWINNICYYSLWPLLKRDGLSLQYFTFLGLWLYLFPPWRNLPKSVLNCLVVVASYTAILAVSIIEYYGSIPVLLRLPDIWVVVNATICFGSYVYFWLWLHIRAFTLNTT